MKIEKAQWSRVEGSEKQHKGIQAGHKANPLDPRDIRETAALLSKAGPSLLCSLFRFSFWLEDLVVAELTAAVNHTWCHWSFFSGLCQDIDHGVKCWNYLNMFPRRGQSVVARVSGKMFFNCAGLAGGFDSSTGYAPPHPTPAQLLLPWPTLHLSSRTAFLKEQTVEGGY